jgi:uncharacterized membrane protein YozB (DUF420 family)
MSISSVLPHILAVINASTIIALATSLVRRGSGDAHRTCMMVPAVSAPLVRSLSR